MKFRTFVVSILAVCLGLLTVACGSEVTMSGDAFDKSKLTYDQVLNTGLANVCPQLPSSVRGSIPVVPGQQFRLFDLCVQPTEFFVEIEPTNIRKEPEFVAAKLLTRATTSLDQVSGTISIGDDSVLNFVEEDGIDFQPITVQLPGGEQVPFLFTIKNLIAASPRAVSAIDASTDFGGEFDVPSYRGAVFLDPKGRGVASGYDTAVAVPASGDDDDYQRANVKRVGFLEGEIDFR
ncbi:MAG: photosystem II manganese-stabilizing polypeptide, partial [Cyanobacteria bacterium J06641_5]